MNYLFEYFDIFLSVITSLILVFVIFSKKSPINTLINFLVCNFMIMVIAFLILNEQIQIGQFIITNMLFLLIVIIAFFYMQKHSYLQFLAEKMERMKVASYVMLFLSILLISVFAFDFLIKPIKRNLQASSADYTKIGSLSQNKIFQSMTEIIIIYAGISVALLFFSKKEVINEK